MRDLACGAFACVLRRRASGEAAPADRQLDFRTDAVEVLGGVALDDAGRVATPVVRHFAARADRQLDFRTDVVEVLGRAADYQLDFRTDALEVLGRVALGDAGRAATPVVRHFAMREAAFLQAVREDVRACDVPEGKRC